MKFRVQNTRHRTVARNCRAYLVGIHEVRGTQVMLEDLSPDSLQLPWEGVVLIREISLPGIRNTAPIRNTAI